ncbi:MAG: thiamine pyrophosphate-binding protein [Chloroflexi bacterium]|nr:thiamine pyrophosphate-binding protein [Chloroflexota bacterium]
MAKVTGARALVDCLLREGVDHVFGIPGTQNLPIMDVLRETPRIRFVLTRHEQGAAFMAYGFARATGRPATVTATEGPGVTNLATGIAAAFRGFVPMISVTGTQEDWVRERDASQEMDQVSFFRPITKWAYSIPSATKVQEAARKAFRVALTEPVGPAHLDASRDVWLGETESEPIAPAAYRTLTEPDCSPAQLDRAMAVLSEAERPVFLIGGGVLREDLIEAVAKLAEHSGIPVASLQPTADAFPTTHPLALGTLGRNGFSSANRTVPRADLIVAVGARIDVFSTTFKYGIISSTAKIVHHCPVPDHIGVVYPVSAAVTGSTASFVAGLAQRVERSGRRWAWVDVAKLRAEWEAERRAQVRADVEPISPPFVAHAIRKVVPRNGIFVLDGGNASKHMRVHWEAYEPRTYMYTDDWGSVGAGLPMGMGAKLARPDRPVMCVEGDMGMMCNIGELETAVRENIPVVCVVFNDQGLGNERGWQIELYGGRIFGVDYQNPDFGALARVFGGYGEQVTQPGELEPALRRALDSGKPAVIDVIIDKETLAPVVYRG